MQTRFEIGDWLYDVTKTVAGAWHVPGDKIQVVGIRIKTHFASHIESCEFSQVDVPSGWVEVDNLFSDLNAAQKRANYLNKCKGII